MYRNLGHDQQIFLTRFHALYTTYSDSLDITTSDIIENSDIANTRFGPKQQNGRVYQIRVGIQNAE